MAFRAAVVGQGLAGTVLAWTLRRAGCEIAVFDAGLPGASSPPAAGLINPVTGKRYVQSWRFDDFFPFARAFYAEITALSGRNYWTDLRLLRALAHPGDANEWAARHGSDSIRRASGPEAAFYRHKPFALAEMNGARVDFPALLRESREGWIRESVFRKMQVNSPDLEKLSAGFDAVFCCEGYAAAQNPFFPDLHWNLAKGEVLIVRFELPLPELTSFHGGGLSAIPLGNHRYWIGSNYLWDFSGPEPENPGAMEEKARQWCALPLMVENCLAGIRPTVKDRRPYLGASPYLSNVFIFNGLGTKGALLAPYWADHLTRHVLSGAPLDPEADVNRIFQIKSA